AGVATPALLVDRGYRPIELSSVLVRPLDGAAGPPGDAPAAGLVVRACGEADRERWVATSLAGWSEAAALAGELAELMRATSQNPRMRCFLVEQDGEPIATGSLAIHERIALLAEARRRGCQLAMMAAAPGGTSQRNAERRGFRVAYTRTKWQRRRA